MGGEILELASEMARNTCVGAPVVGNLGPVSSTISVVTDFLSTTLGKYITVLGGCYGFFDFFHFLGITEGYPQEVEAVGLLSYLAKRQ